MRANPESSGAAAAGEARFAIALGKQTVEGNEYALDEFANDRNAKSYKDWPGNTVWYKQLLKYLDDDSTAIYVNLDGIDDPVSYAASGAKVNPAVDNEGFTRWEMYQVSQRPAAWRRVVFYRNGSVDTNPFLGASAADAGGDNVTQL